MSRPQIHETGEGEIRAFLNGKPIRGWCYSSEIERRWKMRMAREFCEGWFQATREYREEAA